MLKNIKKFKIAMFIGSVVVSIAMVLIGLKLLAGNSIDTPYGMLSLALLVLASFPVTSTLFFNRAIDRYGAEMELYATRDPLTGLYNQHTFWDLLQYETQRARRQGYKFSLLLIDLDNFKIINDKYGHEIGDHYLKAFSSILKTAVRKGDIAARYAGDGFTAILPVCDEEQAFVVSKRIIDTMRTTAITLPDGTEIMETVSIGASVFPSHAEQPHDLYLLADSMLGKAKSAGKDHMSFPSEQDSLALLKDMGETNVLILEALHSRKHTKLVPYFQPIVDVQTRKVLAYEVLTRIIVHDRVIPAADFIVAAENMGAIGKIDYQLIEQAFTIVNERKYPGTLFLNLSPKALIIREFIPTVRSLFRDYGIKPETMVFEITERDTVKNIHIVEDFVHKLRDEGFRFAIDDFGAGYSSFQYLKSFAVDFLKVDGEFIKNMNNGRPVEKEIVSSIAALANRLGIKTIAEYVESENILSDCAAAGIHYAQGYYIKRPSPDLG